MKGSTLQVRLTSQEKELLQRISDDNSRSASATVRYLIRQEAKRLGLIQPTLAASHAVNA